MGIFLDIQKYKTDNDKHYYHVKSESSKDFYMEIDTCSKRINFFGDREGLQFLGKINLEADDRFLDIPGFDYRLLVLATIQAVKAFKANYFPEYISKQS